MLNGIFISMLAVSLVAGFYYGKGEALTAALLSQSSQAVTVALEMTGVICLWSGMMRAAERSGLTETLGRLLYPVTRRLFPGLYQRRANRAIEAITMNLSANLIGLGNAATPLGLAAMERMADLTFEQTSPHHQQPVRCASDDMVVFLICNTASLQLIPSTLAAVRQAAGSAHPLEILPAVWLSSLCTLVVSLASAKLLSRFSPSFPRPRRILTPATPRKKI